jgi:hypothetical protein
MILQITKEHIEQGNWKSIFSNPIALATKEARELPRASYFNGVLTISKSAFDRGQYALVPQPFEFNEPRMFELNFKPIESWRFNWDHLRLL